MELSNNRRQSFFFLRVEEKNSIRDRTSMLGCKLLYCHNLFKFLSQGNDFINQGVDN